MNKYIYLVLAVILILGIGLYWVQGRKPKSNEVMVVPAIEANVETEALVIKDEQISKEANVKNQPAYITDVYSKEGKNYLELDYIEWFHGTPSIQAQIEDGGCPVVEECRSFPNGYQRNKNLQLRTYEISSTAPITVSNLILYNLKMIDKKNFADDVYNNVVITFSNLAQSIATIKSWIPYEAPFKEPKAFVLVDVNNGVVTKLVEPYQE
ncbi:MAG: hypothetical protein WCV68_01900 [Candidatus Paceibacterota bacterium]|jgi:hypothetical protein